MPTLSMASQKPWPQSKPLPPLICPLFQGERSPWWRGEEGRLRENDSRRLPEISNMPISVFQMFSWRQQMVILFLSPKGGLAWAQEYMVCAYRSCHNAHNAFPVVYSSSPKPWKVCIIIPRLQMRQRVHKIITSVQLECWDMNLGLSHSKSIGGCFFPPLYHTMKVSLVHWTENKKRALTLKN